jgi:hypothetical protein
MDDARYRVTRHADAGVVRRALEVRIADAAAEGRAGGAGGAEDQDDTEGCKTA